MADARLNTCNLSYYEAQSRLQQFAGQVLDLATRLTSASIGTILSSDYIATLTKRNRSEANSGKGNKFPSIFNSEVCQAFQWRMQDAFFLLSIQYRTPH